MMIFEDIDCPLCSGTIKVVVEENKIVSHGICPTCDETFSSERLQFTVECQAMEDQFMELISPELYDVVEVIEYEVNDFYARLMEKGVDV